MRGAGPAGGNKPGEAGKIAGAHVWLSIKQALKVARVRAPGDGACVYTHPSRPSTPAIQHDHSTRQCTPSIRHDHPRRPSTPSIHAGHPIRPSTPAIHTNHAPGIPARASACSLGRCPRRPSASPSRWALATACQMTPRATACPPASSTRRASQAQAAAPAGTGGRGGGRCGGCETRGCVERVDGDPRPARGMHRGWSWTRLGRGREEARVGGCVEEPELDEDGARAILLPSRAGVTTAVRRIL
eukprot:54443-Chlamydomonas_euryale.AAC.2